jgi:glyoxylase-like metal-dependent hydrolase (beta-lactamase superfamily II)
MVEYDPVVPAPRLHHLNCGTMCPRGQRLINGEGGLLASARIVCHVLLIEGSDGLVLVDTGFGSDDVRNPRQLSLPFTTAMRPQLQLGETAASQVRELGFDTADVRHIVLTHLDVDHAGGLSDFPQAQVHVWAREHQVMMRPPLRERVRYAIGSAHWAHGPHWATHEFAGDEWLGFESVRVLPDSDAEVLLIPLPGHSLGHTGVALRQADGWLLHCGDAYFYREEVNTPPACPTGLRAYQAVVQANGKLRHQNQERLRELARRHSGEVQLICSHDPVLLERAQARSGAVAGSS